jgi:hypothetical protein
MDDKVKIDFAVTSFVALEKELVNCMEYLPFIEPNKPAISPKFVPIIMDSCSLIDSIFFDLSANSKSERFSLKKYCELFEPKLQLNDDISLFLVSPVQLIQPYKNWTKTPPIWWEAYNSLKHNRLNNYHCANFINAIYALAGIHQLMARLREFIGSFLKIGWIDTHTIEVIEKLSSASHEGIVVDVIIESKLFASPTDDNFVDPTKSNDLYFDINYDANGLSERIRNMLFAHEEW